jgi:hypothetical protein
MTFLLRRTIRNHLRRTRSEKNPQCLPMNTPPVFPGLRPRVWPHLLHLVTNSNVGQAPNPLGLLFCVGSEVRDNYSRFTNRIRRERR